MSSLPALSFIKYGAQYWQLTVIGIERSGLPNNNQFFTSTFQTISFRVFRPYWHLLNNNDLSALVVHRVHRRAVSLSGCLV